MNALKNVFLKEIELVSTKYVRYLHDEIEWKSRLIAILGARGVGKSTLVLQHIKLYEDINTTLYVSADNIYFSAHSLLELANEFYNLGGKALYIDEIHKYKNWSQEIKNIYDSFPDLRIVYTGSSILELEKGGADLSRRKLEYRLPGLSFREYLMISRDINVKTHSLQEVLSHNVEFPYADYKPLALFKDYMKEGFYPFFKDYGYYMRLSSIVNQILENDIKDFAEMTTSTAHALKKLMYIIAQSVPFKPNYSKISNDIDVNRKLVSDLMIYLEKAQLINILRDNSFGISSLGKVEKIYLNNTNLSYALVGDMTDIGNARETVFLSLLKPIYDITSSPYSDFIVDKKYTFELGGKNKKQKQIKDIKDSYLVKDDIEYGSSNIVPLWTFGLLY
ncbi:MAG: ATP-binding protein [Bacteroidales bacterium]|nr:ATP-binding protein [Bacteroidales bacterium]MBR5603372.1 ATP-binding protein [Bacteroidales bacterium]MBR5781769.1 ATP-binding protein [Bacteroidales bacterium]